MTQVAEYDVLIIGARAAGASLAGLLARQGRSVLLVDRDSFPSDTMSTHFMNPIAVGHLAVLGVLDRVVAAGFRRITRSRTWIEDCHLEGPIGPGAAFGLAPRRSVLDWVLIESAVAAGATFMERTRLESLLEEGGIVAGATLRTAGGEPREVRARLTVGADGKSSKVAELVGAEKYEAVAALRPAYYAYFQGVEPLPEPSLEMFYGGDQIGFLFPMRPREDCIAIEFQPEDFDAFRTDARANFLDRVRRLPGLEARLKDAVIEADRVVGTRGVENFLRKPYGQGWALAGDAAYLKDPSTGSGVGDALAGSLLLAPALQDWFEGAPWDETMAAYHRRRDEAVLPYYRATLAHTQMKDPGPQTAGWMRAVAGNPMAARTLSQALPAIADTAFAPGMSAMLRHLAKLYAGTPEPARA